MKLPVTGWRHRTRDLQHYGSWASPSANPAYFAGSRWASIQVRIAKWRLGGSGRLPLSPKFDAYLALRPTLHPGSWSLPSPPVPSFATGSGIRKIVLC